jgi:hypothetical protein
MGNQHNTHVVNKTGETIKVVLTDTDKRNTTQIIEAGAYVCIPTPHGRGTLTVFRKQADGSYPPKAEATYTDDSDRSFIVKLVDGRANVVRSVYGNIWEEETGLR